MSKELQEYSPIQGPYGPIDKLYSPDPEGMARARRLISPLALIQTYVEEQGSSNITSDDVIDIFNQLARTDNPFLWATCRRSTPLVEIRNENDHLDTKYLTGLAATSIAAVPFEKTPLTLQNSYTPDQWQGFQQLLRASAKSIAEGHVEPTTLDEIRAHLLLAKEISQPDLIKFMNLHLTQQHPDTETSILKLNITNIIHILGREGYGPLRQISPRKQQRFFSLAAVTQIANLTLEEAKEIPQINQVKHQYMSEAFQALLQITQPGQA